MGGGNGGAQASPALGCSAFASHGWCLCLKCVASGPDLTFLPSKHSPPP